jgi:hypothetical protein
MRYQITEDVLARSVGGELVLLHPETERLVSLNATGGRIWELLPEEPDPEGIVARLTAEYDGSEPEIREEVLAFLSQLESEQLIRRA